MLQDVTNHLSTTSSISPSSRPELAKYSNFSGNFEREVVIEIECRYSIFLWHAFLAYNDHVDECFIVLQDVTNHLSTSSSISPSSRPVLVKYSNFSGKFEREVVIEIKCRYNIFF